MRPIRLFEEDKLYFITNRTIQGRLLLRPSPLINKTIGAIIARGLNLYSVRLYAFVFTSNYFHIILSGHKSLNHTDKAVKIIEVGGTF